MLASSRAGAGSTQGIASLGEHQTPGQWLPYLAPHSHGEESLPQGQGLWGEAVLGTQSWERMGRLRRWPPPILPMPQKPPMVRATCPHSSAASHPVEHSDHPPH